MTTKALNSLALTYHADLLQEYNTKSRHLLCNLCKNMPNLTLLRVLDGSTSVNI